MAPVEVASSSSSEAPTQKRSYDKQALLAKYAAERDKRLRADGAAQFQKLEGDLASLSIDPYTPRKEREPVHDHVTFCFVGAGFGGLVTGAKLVSEGGLDPKEIRLLDKAGDVGGTWYYNKYPGAQCDTASMVYMPLLEETGHMPTRKYAYQPELQQQAKRIAEKHGLYESALFHTEVKSVEWDETNSVWKIATDRGDSFTAQFLGLGTGPLHVPQVPRVAGITDFKGKSFHTSRWDYSYTGGSPEGAPLEHLKDKTVAIIGTGATAVQCVPHLGQSAKRLYVVQRTPTSVDVRADAPLDSEWFSKVAVEKGWQRKWLENFTGNSFGGTAAVDLVQDGWTDMSRRVRLRIAAMPAEQRTPANMMAAFEDSDFDKMEEIRARVDSIVKDPSTAQSLKAWYRQLCKRPGFHDAYLQTFNLPNVTLLDTDGKGVEKITETGIVANGQEYPVDCIIWSTGFVVGGEWANRAGFDPVGAGGITLSEAWKDGMRSLHGIHVAGFPNLFFVQPAQGANLISNVTHNLVESGATIAQIVAHARTKGAKTVQVTPEAQENWVNLLTSGAPRNSVIGSPDCVAGYYNNFGFPDAKRQKYNVGYPQGAGAYFKYLEGWRSSGQFEGLEFS